MAENRLRLTPKLQQEICAFIRAGSFPEMAAEAAGVPAELFEKWMKSGMRKRTRRVYRAFAAAVRQAIAQARVKAESEAMKKNALNWLKYGPGRETDETRGWTMPVRAGGTTEEEDENLLLRPEMSRLLELLLEALAPFPEARSAAAAALQKLELPEGDPE